MENLVGSKIKGFKFETNTHASFNWVKEMEKSIGKEGVVVFQDEYFVCTVFEEVEGRKLYWSYPLPEALSYVVRENN